MKQLEGYVIARAIETEKDILSLTSMTIFFNKADALEIADPHLIFKVIIPYPQDGKGNIKEDPLPEFFAEFWEAYPKKQAKPPAIRAFKKLKVNAEMFQVMMAALEKHKRSDQWNRGTGQFIPMPSTWLNQRRWEDVVETPASLPMNDKFGHL